MSTGQVENYSNEALTIEDTDLFDISVDMGLGVFESQKITGLTLKSILGGGGGGNTIYTADDSLTGNRIIDQSGFDLTFFDGNIGFKDQISPTAVIDILGDSVGSDMLYAYNELGDGMKVDSAGATTIQGKFSNGAGFVAYDQDGNGLIDYVDPSTQSWGQSIYSSDGTVPTMTTATLTDELRFENGRIGINDSSSYLSQDYALRVKGTTGRVVSFAINTGDNVFLIGSSGELIVEAPASTGKINMGASFSSTYLGMEVGNNTTAMDFTKSGTRILHLRSNNTDGGLGVNSTGSDTASIVMGASKSSRGHFRLTAGVDKTSFLSNGDVWYNGTNLWFRQGTTNYDLLDGVNNGFNGNGSYTNLTIVNGIITAAS